ncbi:MAG: flagellar M-ring protein FliF [Myxococcaceae bacterium]
MKTLPRLAVAVLALCLSACATQIQHGLEERDANEIVSVLVARGFSAKKVPEKGKKPTWSIELDDAEATEAMRVLTELKLPRPQRLKTQALAQSTGLIDTPQAERLRQLEAQEGDIEESLETMDGVASAAVELVVPAPPRPGQPAVASKASVLLRVQPDALERMQMQRAEVRALVAAAVDGLKSDDVVLVIDPVTLPTAAAPVTKPDVFRPLAVVLGAAVSALAFVLVVLAWRLKRKPAAAVSTAPALAVSPPLATGSSPSLATPRPTINPQLQRKVA